MRITLDWLKKNGACSSGTNWFRRKFGKQTDLKLLYEALTKPYADAEEYNYLIWLMRQTPRVTRELIAMGANVNMRYSYGSGTPLIDDVIWCSESGLCRAKNLAVADVLLANGAKFGSINGKRDPMRNTILNPDVHALLKKHCHVVTYEELTDRVACQEGLAWFRSKFGTKADPFSAKTNLDTLYRALIEDERLDWLFWYIEEVNSVDLLNELVSLGYDPDTVEVCTGYTLLMSLVMLQFSIFHDDRLALIERLIQMGANVNAISRTGKSILDYAITGVHKPWAYRNVLTSANAKTSFDLQNEAGGQ